MYELIIRIAVFICIRTPNLLHRRSASVQAFCQECDHYHDIAWYVIIGYYRHLRFFCPHVGATKKSHLYFHIFISLHDYTVYVRVLLIPSFSSNYLPVTYTCCLPQQKAFSKWCLPKCPWSWAEPREKNTNFVRRISLSFYLANTLMSVCLLLHFKILKFYCCLHY